MWVTHGKQDQIVVGLGEGQPEESNVKLMVNSTSST